MATMASSTVLPMVGCLALAWRWRPAGIGGHPEDVLGFVFVGVFGVGPGVVALAGEELGAVFLEGVGDVFEEDEAEDDVLVFGRVHVGAELIGGEPELLLEADLSGAGFGGGGAPGHDQNVTAQLSLRLPSAVSASPRLSAASQSFCSKPTLAVLDLEEEARRAIEETRDDFRGSDDGAWGPARPVEERSEAARRMQRGTWDFPPPPTSPEHLQGSS